MIVVLGLVSFKTLNHLNPSFMSNIFELKTPAKPNRSQQDLHSKVAKPNQVKFGKKSFRALGPKIWNNLTPLVKNAENLFVFKGLIKS